MTMNITEHAKQQAASRNIPVSDVVDAAIDRLTERGIRLNNTVDAAIFVGTTEGGWTGFSNGNCVWAIIRGGTLATVMYRREDQPSTTEALRVKVVIR